MTLQHIKFKTVTLFPIYNQENIPEAWSIDNISNLVKIIDYRGRTPPFSNEGIPHLRSNNIRNGRIILDDLTYVSEDTYNDYMTRGIPQENDVLFTTEGPLGEVALVPQGFEFSLAQRLIILRPKSDILLPQFLKWILLDRKVKSRYFGLATGTTLGGIASKWFTKLIIPFPSDTKEQEKIAYILSKVDELIQKIDQIIGQTLSLKEGLTQRLLTKGIGNTKFKSVNLGLVILKISIPEPWAVLSFAEVLQLIDTPHYTSEYANSGIPVIRTSDCQRSGKINYDNTKFTTQSEYEKRSKIINPDVGDVLYTREAPPGVAAIVDKKEISVGQRIVLLKPNRSRLTGIFLVSFLNSKFGFLQSDARTVKTTVEHVNIEDIKKFRIFLPPLEEQKKISSIILVFDSYVKNYINQKQEYQALKKGLMQTLLTGKIRVKV